MFCTFIGPRLRITPLSALQLWLKGGVFGLFIMNLDAARTLLCAGFSVASRSVDDRQVNTRMAEVASRVSAAK
jgi:hypothetical protein